MMVMFMDEASVHETHNLDAIPRIGDKVGWTGTIPATVTGVVWFPGRCFEETGIDHVDVLVYLV